MGKFISYGCDRCDFLTQNKNELFIPISIQNCEGDELLSSQDMFCGACLVSYISNTCVTRLTKVEKKSSGLLSKILKHDKEEKEEEYHEIDEDTKPITDEESEPEIDEESEPEINEDSESEIEEAIENRTYVKLQQVITKEDEKILLNHLGYKNLADFTKATRLPTLIHSFIPLESGINDLDIDVCTPDAGGVMVDVQNGIPAIRLADFYKTEGGEVYIHINELERVRQQLKIE